MIWLKLILFIFSTENKVHQQKMKELKFTWVILNDIANDIKNWDDTRDGY